MLDIYDINYEYCSEKLGNLNIPPGSLPRKGVFFRILSQINGIIKFGLKRKSGEFLKGSSTLFFAISQNEINSLKPIVDELPESLLFGIDDYKNGFPLGKIYLYSLLYIPLVFYHFIKCKNNYHKRSFSYAFDGFCIAYSSNYILRKYLMKLNPKKIVIANQLSCYHRSLAYVAKDLNIKTVYIQHASVTEGFSDLNIFSSALLEGEDSLIKYQNNGTSNMNLYLVGMPKFDKYFTAIKENKEINTIGLCTNGMDDFSAFGRLVNVIREKLPEKKIVIRPHPSDRRYTDWHNLAIDKKCLFSNVREVESFVFFKDVDLIVAGDSNIHLEAALLNIPSIYFDTFGKNLDWYGFAATELVFYALDEQSVYKAILDISSNVPNTRSKAKFYVETVETKFDGKSSKLAAMLIEYDYLDNCFESAIDKNKNLIYRVMSN